MALTKLTENLNIIQSLADKPTETATQLKQKFDEAANDIKTYINGTLTDEVDTLVSGINGDIASLDNRLDTAEASITEISGDITTIEGTLSGLKSGATTKITIGSTTPGTLDNGEVYIQYFE